MAKKKPRKRSERQQVRALAWVLVLVTLVLYAQVVVFGFINLDDPDYVYGNPQVESGLTAGNIAWAFTLHGPGQWHPLTWISHQLDCELFALDAGMHHLVNVLFHVANVVLLFLVLNRMTSAVFPSFLVAALFGWHPLSVESVAWVSERRDVLSTLFWMLALHAYCDYARKGGGRRYGWVALFVGCGLMSKPMVVTLPCAMLLLDVWPLRRWDGVELQGQLMPQRTVRYLVLEKTPLLALSFLASLFTFLIQVQEQAVGTLEGYPPQTRIANAVVSYAGYLRKMLIPNDLTFFYPYPESLPILQVTTCACFLAAVTAVCLWQVRQRTYLLVGWLWYLGTLVPVIGLVQVGGQAMADRYTYIPLIGIYMALAWAGWEWMSRIGAADARWQRGVAVLLLAPCLVISYPQIGYWKSGITLNRHALDLQPGNALAHNQIAAAYLSQGNRDEAQHHFERSMQLNPDFIQPYMGLAQVAEETADPVTALEYLQQARQRNEHAMAEPIIARRLAWILAAAPQEELRDAAESLVLAKRCVELTGGVDPYCLHTLAVALAANGEYSRALAVANRALPMARAADQQDLVTQIRQSLDGYQQQQPFRDPRW